MENWTAEKIRATYRWQQAFAKLPEEEKQKIDHVLDDLKWGYEQAFQIQHMGKTFEPFFNDPNGYEIEDFCNASEGHHLLILIKPVSLKRCEGNWAYWYIRS